MIILGGQLSQMEMLVTRMTVMAMTRMKVMIGIRWRRRQQEVSDLLFSDREYSVKRKFKLIEYALFITS